MCKATKKSRQTQRHTVLWHWYMVACYVITRRPTKHKICSFVPFPVLAIDASFSKCCPTIKLSWSENVPHSGSDLCVHLVTVCQDMWNIASPKLWCVVDFYLHCVNLCVTETGYVVILQASDRCTEGESPTTTKGQWDRCCLFLSGHHGNLWLHEDGSGQLR